MSTFFYGEGDYPAPLPPLTPEQAQDDFRRHEITEMNAAAVAEDREKQMARWGLIGLAVVAAFALLNSNPRR